MQTSAQGHAALELEEGVVLRAYRDSVGVWTIGAGLTAASGVVRPVAGMVITRSEADALLARALAQYERDVQVAMTPREPSVQRMSGDCGAGTERHVGGGIRVSQSS